MPVASAEGQDAKLQSLIDDPFAAAKAWRKTATVDERAAFDFDVLREYLRQLNGAFSATLDSGYAPGSDAAKKARGQFYKTMSSFEALIDTLARASQAVAPATADERACPFCEAVHDGNSCMEAYRERASQAAAPAEARERIPDERAVLASILRGMCEGGGAPHDVDIYAEDYSAPDGDVFVLRAAELLDSARADTGEAVSLTAAARDVLAERARQVNEEGFTPDRDDRYTAGQLAQAAAAYAIAVADHTNPLINSGAAFYTRSPDIWPWSENWWKPNNPRRALVKAAALVIAEIERLDRAAQGAQSEGGEA